ncbi:MAG: flagellar basal-body MS-ring/collar protein FliF [Cypionkella sp.]
MLQNLLSLWQSLNLRRRVIILGATLAMFMAIFGLSRLTETAGLTLLYAGLEPAAAGDVVAALDQRGVTYEIRGGSIYVDGSQRDSLRMTLAAEGLPAAGGSGYELLDGLSGFGTTSQMFDAAYWRAKEGELARTILANPQVRAARVHIAQAPDQPFQRDAQPSASVTVTTKGGTLATVQAKAIRHLVAAAVPGMRPEAVQVIDSVAGLIDPEPDAALSGGTSDTRAAEIKRNVERLLEARVGPGKAVVEVAVDVVTERETITETTFDPQGKVAISSETETRSGTSTDPAGDVTVASNLPAGNAAADATGKSENKENRERVNYEVSQTQRDVLRIPGALRKISVAVLIDGEAVTAADGTVSQQPRADSELVVLRELVASAVGLDETRGDVLVVKSLTFQPEAATGDLVTASLFSQMGPLNVMSLIQIVVLGLVALVLALFVIRPLITSGHRRSEVTDPASNRALPGPAEAHVLTGEIDDGQVIPAMSLVSPEDDVTDPVALLRRLITERQSESVEILRGWMEMHEERG